MNDVVDIPLVSGDEGERMTVRTHELSGLDGPVATLSRAPRVIAHNALETARTEGFDALQDIPICELLQRIADAARRFENIGPPNDDLEPLDEYAHRITRATGLPKGWVRTSTHWLASGLRHAPEALRAQSPTADLDVYDRPAYVRERNVRLAFAPQVRVLGAVMPSNDPTVYAWPALALAMKVPIVVCPADRDPFTALRLARAIRAAGIPRSAVHILPAAHEIGDLLRREADHTLLFGSASTVDPYRNESGVETYGPGNSVAVATRNPTDRELDTLARGIVRSGGRACFNLTRIITTDDCDPDTLADRLAERIADATDGTPFSSDTDVPTFPNADRAKSIDEHVTAVEGTDIMAGHRSSDRLVETADSARLQPTLLRTPTLVDELPFPYAGITHRSRENVRSAIDGAYLGVCIGDGALERELVRSPNVEKVYGGRYPATVDLRETHETFLTDFLYGRSTYDPS
jgi:acyl-CoA reductase-like NAD-dependent aldehyde dehydrogenase